MYVSFCRLTCAAFQIDKKKNDSCTCSVIVTIFLCACQALVKLYKKSYMYLPMALRS